MRGNTTIVLRDGIAVQHDIVADFDGSPEHHTGEYHRPFADTTGAGHARAWVHEDGSRRARLLEQFEQLRSAVESRVADANNGGVRLPRPDQVLDIVVPSQHAGARRSIGEAGDAPAARGCEFGDGPPVHTGAQDQESPGHAILTCARGEEARGPFPGAARPGENPTQCRC